MLVALIQRLSRICRLLQLQVSLILTAVLSLVSYTNMLTMAKEQLYTLLTNFALSIWMLMTFLGNPLVGLGGSRSLHPKDTSFLFPLRMVSPTCPCRYQQTLKWNPTLMLCSLLICHGTPQFLMMRMILPPVMGSYYRSMVVLITMVKLSTENHMGMFFTNIALTWTQCDLTLDGRLWNELNALLMLPLSLPEQILAFLCGNTSKRVSSGKCDSP